jgi:hypothetical protein
LPPRLFAAAADFIPFLGFGRGLPQIGLVDLDRIEHRGLVGFNPEYGRVQFHGAGFLPARFSTSTASALAFFSAIDGSSYSAVSAFGSSLMIACSGFKSNGWPSCCLMALLMVSKPFLGPGTPPRTTRRFCRRRCLRRRD